jgi:signal transduction histidine kinase
MRNKRTIWLWLSFFLIALIGTMGWVTKILLTVDRQERDSNRRSAKEQNVRLALWRMENRLYGLASAMVSPPEWAKNGPNPVILGGFVGTPETNMVTARPETAVVPTMAELQAILQTTPSFDSFTLESGDEETDRNRLEAICRFNLRKRVTARFAWYQGNVILAAPSTDGRIIGWIFDWSRLRQMLEHDCRPMISNPELTPLFTAMTRRADRDLALLPLRLSGELEPTILYERTESPARLMLLVAWSCIFLPAAGLGILLFASYSLNERRDAFVSAVTHELRTPLTTFSMYTEMLDGGMVPEEKRAQYVSTLRVEAERLSHLVENVLAYARIERGKKTGVAEPLVLSEFLERLQPRLLERCERGGVELTVESAGDDASMKVDPGGLERIVFNLVDNACKYGTVDGAGQVEIRIDRGSKGVVLSVRDHGAGVDDAVAQKLFKPFGKSDKEAAGGIPGVGLGLALSRQLAQSMGGRLWLDDGVESGACFKLRLPVVEE